MPRTEPSSAAGLGSAPKAAQQKRPWRSVDGAVLVDWKDLTSALLALLFFFRARYFMPGLELLNFALVGLFCIAPVARRFVFGGPAPITRVDGLWIVARTFGTLSLFMGFFLLVLVDPAREGWQELLLGACGCLAFGAVVDEAIRVPEQR